MQCHQNFNMSESKSKTDTRGQMKRNQELFNFFIRFAEGLYIACVSEGWQSIAVAKAPHIFVDELAAIESESKTFLKDLTDHYERYPEGMERKLWLTVDVLQSLDSFLFGFSDVGDKDCITGAKRTHLKFVHRCAVNVFEVSFGNLRKLEI